MASLSYLWTNRAKFPIGSKNFYRAWGKRFFSLPEILKMNRRRAAYVSKGADIHECAEIGEAKIAGKLKLFSIGKYSFLGKVYIAVHDEVLIGEKVCINDGVEILTASHDIADPEWKQTKAKVVIGNYAWIGTGAMILPGVTIGEGAVVGARAVVTKSIAPGSIVVGNPAKPIGKQRANNLNYNPCESLAGNRSWLIG